jgi:adenine-specific DNA-methyltransferase
MNKLSMHTPNLVDENIRKLAELFPNAVTERKNEQGQVERAVDFDVLRQELSQVVVEGPQERYQFTWPDKRQSMLLANAPISDTLRPCREESVDFDTTQNLYIEGDNLNVLKLLRETYLGKVKMIYIDPPYNTGKDSFVYDDDFDMYASEFSSVSGQRDEDRNILFDIRQNHEANGRFHTDWLNMMYPRLRLAKDLLAEDGVIFISIDDNEQANLKKVCDEVFGIQNFVAQLVWEKKKKGSFLSNSITNVKEYIVVYSKNLSLFKGLIGEINREVETYPCINASNKREVIRIPAGIQSKYKEATFCLEKGTEISDTTMTLLLHSDMKVINNVLAEDLVIEGNWRYSQEAMREFAENGELYITRDRYLRRIVSDARYKTLKDWLPRQGDDPNQTYNEYDLDNLFSSGWGSNEDADEELRLLFGVQRILDYPKPLKLIIKLLASLRESKNEVIMDFFSGSSTTAHAVMQLNAEDDGNRKFIMVQLPETTDEKSEAYKAGYKNICEIGKERIRRAGAKIKEELNKQNQQIKLDEEPKPLPDTGFRVLKLDSSNMKDVYYTPTETTQIKIEDLADNIKQDRTPEDLLFQVMLELGVLPSSAITEMQLGGKRVFSVAEGFLLACFDSNINETTITEIAKLKPHYAVFRDSGYANDGVATNFEQIFKAYSPQTVRRVL